MANSSLSLVSLDFDSLKNNLKTYLKSQSTFKDYDFEGSNMNVLLDVLSYNTYLNSFYLNMAVSEGFLDSAQMRSSVISHAKELNYTPRSARSAKSLVNLTIDISETISLTPIRTLEIPKGAQFSGTNARGSYVFTTNENHVLTSTSSIFTINDLEIYEGTYINETFIVDSSVENQKYILSNANVDTSSVNVTVVENDGLNTYDYKQAVNLYGLTKESKAYFIQATLDGYYEVVFGDDDFGRRPKNNSTVLVTYRITNGAAGNDIVSFNIDKDLGSYNNVTATVTVSTVSTSVDGDDVETIESIRFRAPKHYQTQDRAITNNDYANMIYENFPEVKAVNVYGGENIFGSVESGKVFISPVGRSGADITDSLKTDIISYLSNKNSIGITPIITNPNYLYIVPTITASVDFNSTNKTPADIKSQILNTVSSYNTSTLQNFNTTFRHSKFLSVLNNIDDSIESVQVKNLLKKIANPNLEKLEPITVSFNNKIIPGTVISTTFLLYDGFTYEFTDYNPNKNTFLRTGSQATYNITNTSKTMYIKQNTGAGVVNYLECGSINYETGDIAIKNYRVANFLNHSGIEFYCSALSNDINGIKNDLIEIDIDNITVDVVSV